MTISNVQIKMRSATEQDHPAVAAVCRANERSVWPLESLTAHPSRISVVALFDDQIIGVAKTRLHAEPDRDAPAGHYLGGVVVHPQWRGNGVGTQLTIARLNWIWHRADRAYYFTNEHNAASIRLHGALGFRPIAAEPAIRGVSADDGKSNLILFQLTGNSSNSPV